MANGGGGGSSASSADTTTNTSTQDRRLVVDNGALGLSTDNSSINVSMLDSGSVQGGIDTAQKAIDAVSQADVINGEGFSKLLNLTENLFAAGNKLLDSNSQTAMAAVNAVNTARNDAQGSVDQKTIVILSVAAVAMAYAFTKKG